MQYPNIYEGDKVSFEYDGEKYTTVVGVDVNGEVRLPVDVFEAVVSIGYQDNLDIQRESFKNFRILERADGTPVANVGDVLCGETKHLRKVLAVSGDALLVSYINDFESSCVWMLQSQIKKSGYSIKPHQPSTPKEMTVAEVSEKLGYEVKIKKG